MEGTFTLARQVLSFLAFFEMEFSKFKGKIKNYVFLHEDHVSHLCNPHRFSLEDHICIRIIGAFIHILEIHLQLEESEKIKINVES